MNDLLSLIIPTKNRSFYCMYAIKQILALKLPEIEICIQDNSDTDDLRREIESLKSDQVVYNYHAGILSFVDNFSEAVSISHGEYVCMIGDDDGILPNIVEYVEKAKKNNYDAIIPGLDYVYFWPSQEPIEEDINKGRLDILHSRRRERIVDTNKAIKRLLSNASQEYTCLDIPRLYHGIVKRSVLDRVKDKTGYFFGGLTPDMYMAAVLSLECGTVLKTTESFTISGICPKSGSADSATGRHTGKLSDAPHFKGHSSYVWNVNIPPFYSVDTIWSETLLNALESYNRRDLVDLFNLPLLEALCLKKYPEYSSIIMEHAKDHDITKLKMTFSYIYYIVPKIAKKVWRKAIRVFMGILDSKHTYKKRILNISTIIDAERTILELMN